MIGMVHYWREQSSKARPFHVQGASDAANMTELRR